MSFPTPDEGTAVRGAAEIQRAHDLLAGIILGEVPLPLDAGVRRGIQIAGDVLCWVLGHDHNPAFGVNLERLEQAAAAAGYELVPGPERER